ncbi:hypothetical protein F4803DRAFT_573040 [Xylaria telfairii]|nr:hypothetical protein F4803DRAFT_573040 [Xylaria telfairii]
MPYPGAPILTGGQVNHVLGCTPLQGQQYQTPHCPSPSANPQPETHNTQDAEEARLATAPSIDQNAEQTNLQNLCIAPRQHTASRCKDIIIAMDRPYEHLYPKFDGISTNDVQLFFNRPSMPHSPSTPQAFQAPQTLLDTIKRYFQFSCQSMHFDNDGSLLTQSGAKLNDGSCKDFDSYCYTTAMLKEKGLNSEFIRVLSKACSLVKQILQAEHPRTLTCFFEVFIHLIQSGLPQVTSSLRTFIKQMFVAVIGKDLFWAMVQFWRCTADAFDNELGPLKGGAAHSLPRVMLNLVHNLNRQGRYGEAQTMALKVRFLLQNHEMYIGRIVEDIESLKIISHSQFYQRKPLKAEETMQEAIQKIVEHWGEEHSWVLEFRSVPEGWLRGWGREDDANALRGDIEGG